METIQGVGLGPGDRQEQMQQALGEFMLEVRKDATFAKAITPNFGLNTRLSAKEFLVRGARRPPFS